MARKRKLTDRLKDHILSLIADGLTIRELFSREDVPISWQSFRTYLINDNDLMSQYIKSKELAIDLKLSELEDKRKELEAKIETGSVDPKSAQNLVNLYKIITAHSQWSASKLSSKTYGKAAETLQIKSNNDSNLAISWMKPD
jgi:hypothetical protein